ncbi:hypothetical protein [Algivirga pacifica]|uniref:DUF4238 domain-containing protein n=1 Tax=Algivirga pacifica TaxID=1162670 RepID=A0ABP9DPT2_9BACT
MNPYWMAAGSAAKGVKNVATAVASSDTVQSVQRGVSEDLRKPWHSSKVVWAAMLIGGYFLWQKFQKNNASDQVGTNTPLGRAGRYASELHTGIHVNWLEWFKHGATNEEGIMQVARAIAADPEVNFELVQRQYRTLFNRNLNEDLVKEGDIYHAFIQVVSVPTSSLMKVSNTGLPKKEEQFPKVVSSFFVIADPLAYFDAPIYSGMDLKQKVYVPNMTYLGVYAGEEGSMVKVFLDPEKLERIGYLDKKAMYQKKIYDRQELDRMLRNGEIKQLNTKLIEKFKAWI